MEFFDLTEGFGWQVPLREDSAKRNLTHPYVTHGAHQQIGVVEGNGEFVLEEICHLFAGDGDGIGKFRRVPCPKFPRPALIAMKPCEAS